MWFEHLIILLVAATTTVHAEPQREIVNKPSRPRAAEPALPTANLSKRVADPAKPAAALVKRNLPLPGFCPTDIIQILGDLLGFDNEDCRCGQSLGGQVADAETNVAQPLGAAPNWANGNNDCGCSWGENQCGCYDGISNGDGWLLGTFGDVGNSDNVDNGGDRGGDDNGGGKGRCTVIITETVTFPFPEPTNPGECGDRDRYCTVTVTESEGGGGGDGGGGEQRTTTVTERTETSDRESRTTDRTETSDERTETSDRSETTERSTDEGGGGGTRSTSRDLTTSNGQTLSRTTSRTTVSEGGSSRTSSVVTFQTVNAAPMQTGAIALGAMFGGAAVLVNV